MHKELKDVDHVRVEIKWGQDLEIYYNFSEYTRNKITLMYGIILPTMITFDFTEEEEDDIQCFIPRCYRSGSVFLLPFHEYEKLCEFIETEIGHKFGRLENKKITSVAKSNKESENRLYDFLRNKQQIIIDELNDRQKSTS